MKILKKKNQKTKGWKRGDKNEEMGRSTGKSNTYLIGTPQGRSVYIGGGELSKMPKNSPELRNTFVG